MARAGPDRWPGRSAGAPKTTAAPEATARFPPGHKGWCQSGTAVVPARSARRRQACGSSSPRPCGTGWSYRRRRRQQRSARAPMPGWPPPLAVRSRSPRGRQPVPGAERPPSRLQLRHRVPGAVRRRCSAEPSAGTPSPRCQVGAKELTYGSCSRSSPATSRYFGDPRAVVFAARYGALRLSGDRRSATGR